jgi:hypothetical protein
MAPAESLPAAAVAVRRMDLRVVAGCVVLSAAVAMGEFSV